MTGTINAYGPLFQSAKITPAIRKAAQKALDYGEYRIRSRSPVRTGRLRRGWNLKLDGYGVRITNDVPYAIYNEMGTKYMGARPMAAPTIKEMQGVFAKELAKEVGKALSVKVQGSVEADPLSASSPKDNYAYQKLTQGGEDRGASSKSEGFRSTGARPATLGYAAKSAYNRTFGKAFPKPPGKLQRRP